MYSCTTHYHDEIQAFKCDGYELEFDSPNYANEAYDGYRNRTPLTPFLTAWIPWQEQGT